MSAFAEFFAGIGLVRLALEPLGWRCVFANDIDPKKAEIYRQNFPSKELVVGDIFHLTSADIPGGAALWTASFPCVDLSLAGNRRGLAGGHSGAYWGFIELLRGAHKSRQGPSLVLLENVLGFATSHDGRDLAEALGALSDLGYHYDMAVVDARYFSAQSRPRLFVIAEHESVVPSRLSNISVLDHPLSKALRPPIIQRFVDTHPYLSWARLPLPPLPDLGPALGSIIERLPEDDELWWDLSDVERLIHSMSDINRQRLDQMLASSMTEFGTVYRRVRYGRTVAELRWDGLAGCLRTPRGGSSKQFLLVAGTGCVRVRELTVRECARLQGVPETFRLDVPRNQAWFGLGDAVCVPAVRWLAEHFAPVLEEESQQLRRIATG